MKSIEKKILSFPGLADFPADFLPEILSSRGISPATASEEIEYELMNLLIADVLVFAVNMPDFKEGKLSVSYPRQYFISTARNMYMFNGEPEKANRLSNRIKVPRGRATQTW